MLRAPIRARGKMQRGDGERLLLALWFCGWLLLPSTTNATECVSDGRYVMGTVLEITLCADSAQSVRQHFGPLFTTALGMDAVLTTYNPTSPVSRLNATAGQGPFAVPHEVSEVLALSLRYAQLTRGTFDVTVGPLMLLWRDAAHRQTFPTWKELRKVRSMIGSEKVHLLPHNTVVLRPGMAVDFGGIGKGYALDHLERQLKQQGIQHALLDFGQSSLWAVGAPPEAQGWRILLQHSNGAHVGVLTLRDQALSISASMGQVFEIKGRRYGHVIDPRTGHPLRRDLLACVIAPTATQAEALSKALLILGEHEGIALLQRLPGVDGMLSETTGASWMTPGWQQAVSFSASPTVR
jgi:FAD:protein FMN transferase